MGRREADGRSDVEKFRKNIGLSSFYSLALLFMQCICTFGTSWINK